MSDLTGFKKDRYGTYIDKDPDSLLDYNIDWADWLDTDTISTSTWTISTITGDSAPITTTGNTSTATKTTILLQGGTAGNIYTITNRITTAGGIRDERYFRIVVKNKSA